MEIISEGKHFRLLPENELPKLLDYLEQFLPESLKFHQTVKTYLNDKIWHFNFYVSKNYPEDPIVLHFPGCTHTPNKNIYESFGIFCPTKRIELVDLMQSEDVLINWQKPLYLNFTHKAIMDRLNSFYSTGGGIMHRLEGDIYVYKKLNNELELEPLPSDEVEMRPLNVENVQAIHDLYPASEIECVEVFEKLVQVLPGVGIFRKNTNELAAWMVHSYYGAMFSMQTKPQYRRKGYGIHLAKTLTQKVIERGYLPFVVIRPENEASRSLYTKLGFKKVYETVRATFAPAHKENGQADSQNDEGIEDMLAEKCEITNGKSTEDCKDEGIDENCKDDQNA